MACHLVTSEVTSHITHPSNSKTRVIADEQPAHLFPLEHVRCTLLGSSSAVRPAGKVKVDIVPASSVMQR